MKQVSDIYGLPQFDPKGEPHLLSVRWKRWKRSFKLYMASKGVTNEGQGTALLFHSGGMELQETYYTLVSEDTETAFNDCLAALDNHFTPKVNVPLERDKGKSVSEFEVRSKKLASTCSFGNFLSQALKDRLVSGLHPKMSRTQRHLLSIRELTYSMAHDKYVADEMESKANIEHMADSANSDAEKVQQVYSRRNVEQNSKRADKCKSCGSMQHGSEQCRFKNVTCHHCQEKGHIRPVCKARLSQMQFKGR